MSRARTWFSVTIGLATGLIVWSGAARAQPHITYYNAGATTPIPLTAGSTGNYAISQSTGGQRAGSNLIQTFGTFKLSQGESASFAAPQGVTTIIGRVIGGQTSTVNGQISAPTNLFLVNPSGIVFGPGASVNVQGSFHASSADYMKMSDGTIIPTGTNATLPANVSTLSTASPQAFGFLSSAPKSLTVTGAALLSGAGTVALVGGDVSITQQSALNGNVVHIRSAAGPGEIPVDPVAGPAPTVASFGRITIDNSTIAANASGSVVIHGGSVTIANRSEISVDDALGVSGGQLSLRGETQVGVTAGSVVHAITRGTGAGASVSLTTGSGGTFTIDAASIYTGATSGTSGLATGGNAGGITVNVGSLVLTNGGVLSSATYTGGRAGDVTAVADSVTLSGGSTISASTSGTGRAGDVSVSAAADVTIAGQGATLSAIQSETIGTATGSAGTLQVRAGSIALTDGAISSSSYTTGAAGTVNVVAQQGITLSGAGNPGPNSTVTTDAPGIVSNAYGTATGSGNAGAVYVGAGSLSITQGASVSSSTYGPGNASTVTVAVPNGPVTIDAMGTTANFTGITSQSRQLSTGNAASTFVTARSLSIAGGGAVSTSTYGSGAAGVLTVNLGGTLTIDGSDTPSGLLTGLTTVSGSAGTRAGNLTLSANNVALTNGGAITAATTGPGNAGDVLIETVGGISASGGSQISSSTFGTGTGGGVNVLAGGIVALSGAGTQLSAFSGVPRNAASANDPPIAYGPGGNVYVHASGLTVSGGAVVGGQASGTGAAGSVSVDLGGGSLTIDGTGAPAITIGYGAATGLTSAASAGSTGAAGDIVVQAGNVTVRSGGQIASSSFGAGKSGSVYVDAIGDLAIDGASTAQAVTGVVAQTFTGPRVTADQVIVQATNVSIANGGEMSAATYGAGRAGNVTVAAADAMTLTNGGFVTSSSTGSGDAGSIRISANGNILIGGAAASSSGVFAYSGGSGAAGSIRIDAHLLEMLDGGAINSSASNPPGSAANGGISVNVASLLLVDHATITTLITNGGANSGNITLSAQDLVIENASLIDASAAGGTAGLINPQTPPGHRFVTPDSLLVAHSQTQTADRVVQSQSNTVTAGLVELSGRILDLAALNRTACAGAAEAARASSLVVRGTGGTPRAADAPLPGGYFAGRPLHAAPVAPGSSLSPGTGRAIVARAEDAACR